MAHAERNPNGEVVPLKPGPKPIEITAQHLRIIEKMAGIHTLDQIAWVCGVSPSTLDRWMAHEEVQRAYNVGRVHAADQVASSLFQAALDGDMTAAIFYLKSRAGWTDKPKEEPKQATTSNVVVFIPDNNRGDREIQPAPEA